MPNDDQIDLNNPEYEETDGENEMEGFHLIDEDEKEKNDISSPGKKDDDYDDDYRNDF